MRRFRKSKKTKKEEVERVPSIFYVDGYISHGKIKRRYSVKGYGDVEIGDVIIVDYNRKAKKWVRSCIGYRAQVKEVYYTIGQKGGRRYGMVVNLLEGPMAGFWYRVSYKREER